MLKNSQEQLRDQFNFINFDDILIHIRNSFITETEVLGLLSEMRLNSRLFKKILKHCVLEEVLKTYTAVQIGKINVILIEVDTMSVITGELFDSALFCTAVLRILDSCKRKLPILIKKYSGDIDFDEFIVSGDGQQYLMTIFGDRDRLRNEICSFREFKNFARRNQLRYIVENVLGDVNFKKLFIS